LNFQQENYRLFLAVNHFAGHWPWLDALMVFCANQLIFLWPLLMLLFWGRPLLWRKRELRPGETDIAQECRSVVLWIGVACFLSYLLNLGIELFVFEPRPFISHHVHLLAPHPADASFPSDHTAWSFAVVGMLVLSFPLLLSTTWQHRLSLRKAQGCLNVATPLILMGLALLMACIIGIARVFIGVHYPGDIVGGSLSGFIAAGVVTFLRRCLQRPTLAVIQLLERLRLA
jgi:undecaprenyl-diphosphatase